VNNMKQNIYCSRCLEKDGLQVALIKKKSMECPQCGSKYFITSLKKNESSKK